MDGYPLIGQGFPVCGKQTIEIADGGMGQAAQDVGEVVVGIDASASAAAQQGVEDGAAPTCAGMSDEEPAFAADGGGPDRVFDQVVVDLKTAVFEISGQSIVLVEEIVEGFAHGALGQERGLEFGGPGFHPVPDFRGLQEALAVTFRGRKLADLVFNSVKQSDLGNKPDGASEAFLERFVGVAARMSQAADARNGGLFAAERLVDFIGVGLNRAGKTGKTAADGFKSAAGIKLDEDIASGHGIEPEIALAALPLTSGS